MYIILINIVLEVLDNLSRHFPTFDGNVTCHTPVDAAKLYRLKAESSCLDVCIPVYCVDVILYVYCFIAVVDAYLSF